MKKNCDLFVAFVYLRAQLVAINQIETVYTKSFNEDANVEYVLWTWSCDNSNSLFACSEFQIACYVVLCIYWKCIHLTF